MKSIEQHLADFVTRTMKEEPGWLRNRSARVRWLTRAFAAGIVLFIASATAALQWDVWPWPMGIIAAAGAGVAAASLAFVIVVFGGDPGGAVKPCTDEEYVRMRHQVEHEDNLVNHRVSWLVTSQALFFAAYAIGFTASTTNSILPADDLKRVLLLIALLGLCSAILTSMSIAAAVAALTKLRLIGRTSTLRPPLASENPTRFFGMVPPMALPLLFIFVWALLVVVYPY